MTDRSLIDLGAIDAQLDLKHLEKDTQTEIRKIEESRKSGFTSKGSKVGTFS